MVSKNTVQIRKIESLKDEIEKVENSIRERAYQNFLQRGGAPGTELDDWLKAQYDLILSPPLTVVESDDHLVVLLSLPNTELTDIEVLSCGEMLVVRSADRPLFEIRGSVRTREFEPRQVFRHILAPRQIHPESVRLEFQSGVLRLTANFAETGTAFRAKTA